MRRHTHTHAGAIEGRASRGYDLIARRLMPRAYRRIAADAARSAPEGAAVLDIGTGPGMLLLHLHRARPDLELVGVDLSADMVALAERNLGPAVATRTADVAELPFASERFDLVLSSFSAHHWADPAAGAAEIARVLRPGGRLLIYDFARAPYETLTAEQRLTVLGKGPLRTGLGPLLRCTRFEAAAEGEAPTARP
jgi:ubiquinone/menaquinone biosynthesis C-methylase UbiE